ncbi:MAG: TetR/AcrR family transcriptional regulator [Sphingomonadaceae bacterium]
MSDAPPTNYLLPGTRGDPEHVMRQRILAAANARFRHYGYGKTTVADIASDVGISTAYVYKFFASKLAICEAMLGETLGEIGDALHAVVAMDAPAAERLRALYQTLLSHSLKMYMDERRMHDMIRAGLDQGWQAVEHFKETMRAAARAIIEDGRASGEFETRTPLADVVDAIWISMVPFAHPAVLEHLNTTVDLDRHARHMANLALRGLAKG